MFYAPSGVWLGLTLPDQPNQRWSLDFVSDALNNGRRLRILTVVDVNRSGFAGGTNS